MATKMFCVICGEKKDKVLPFSNETLEKSSIFLQVRKKFNLKYSETILPDGKDDVRGYHVRCYKNFTAVQKKYLAEYTAVSSLPSSCANDKTVEGAEPIAGTSSAGGSCGDTGVESEREPEPMVEVIFVPCESDGTPHILKHGPSTADTSGAGIVRPDDEGSHQAEDPIANEKTGLDDSCIFCAKGQKRVKMRTVPLHSFKTKESFNKLIESARVLNDIKLLTIIDGTDVKSSTFKYHTSCLLSYTNDASSTSENKSSDWHAIRHCHTVATRELFSFIGENVIKKKQCHSMSFLCDLYNRCLENFTQATLALPSSSLSQSKTEERVQPKIEAEFGNQVQIIIMHKKKILAPSRGAVVDESTYSVIEDADLLQRAALILRDRVLKIKAKKLPSRLSAQDLIDGECSIPDDVHEFYLTLLGGIRTRRRQSVDCSRKVKSLCYDIINAVQHGKIKTAKHLTLGIALKSLTSSRKIIDIMNRYGHCLSYNVIEELETELTFSTSDQSDLCPQDMNRSPHLCTGVAYDNYDRFVDTATGKDTLHDTVGIIFQNIAAESATVGSPEPDNSDNIPPTPAAIPVSEPVSCGTSSRVGTSHETPKRRRTYDAIIPELVACSKRPKMIQVLLPVDDERLNVVPSCLRTCKKIDPIWTLAHALKILGTPMWVGYNNLILDDDENKPKQRISYLTPINMSPTNNSVVLETMNQGQKIAEECNQRYMQITYDLAIAKVAMQIQATEDPKFNNLFIHMGSFHIMMAYFHAVGKFIDDCGLSHVMVEGELLASGSVGGFIAGKHFNRCKRLHPIVALGLRIMHLQSFFDHSEVSWPEDIIPEVENFSKQKFTDSTEISPALNQLLEKYMEYEEDTKAGKFGKTSQFYMTYITLIDYYFIFSKSIRIGDFELFKYIIPKIANLFFVFNQPNYARWLVKYHDNLLKVEDTHPELINDLKKGSFGIKRTDKSFSRQPIDLTLEQTFNADAAKRLTGITHFTNSISARQRWARSHGIRSTIISYIYEDTGLIKPQDVSAELQENKIKTNTDLLNNFMTSINKNVNPFSHQLEKADLYNIGTGKATSKNVADFLLNIETTGNKLRENFIAECNADAQRFEKPLKKCKIANFSSEGQKKKVKVGNKVQELRMQRDLFGRLLGVSIEQKIDLRKALSYPLTPVPMALCHLDGTIYKTDKSALMGFLEKKVTSKAPDHVDVAILDGFFLLHLMKDIPRLFGNVSKKIFQMITGFKAHKIHLIFDRYSSPSIKDYERDSRNATETEYTISGPDQARPPDFIKELRNSKFKEALVRFLINHWANEEFAELIGGKIVYLNFDKCYRFMSQGNKMLREIDPILSCPSHEEADTKMIYHVATLGEDYTGGNVLLRCSDTDILIILLGNLKYIKRSYNIWMEVGTGNFQRYIDVSKLHEHLGEALSSALPGYHAFTGCDYNPAFFRKGKIRPWKMVEDSPEYQEAFTNLAELHRLTRDTAFEVVEQFVCEMYSTTCTTVNEARFQLFTKNYTPQVCDRSISKKIQKLRCFQFAALQSGVAATFAAIKLYSEPMDLRIFEITL